MVPQQAPPRTVFYHERILEVVGFVNASPIWDVAPQQFYSAPWLIPPGTVPESSGAIERFQGSQELMNPRSTARVYDRLEVRLTGPNAAVGSRLQVIRVADELLGVGQVVQPTGILLVEETTPAGVIAVVESQFDVVGIGDLVRPLPNFVPTPAATETVPITGGVEATVIAYAADHPLQTFRDYAFLDAGAAQGVRIGDEYVAIIEDTPDFGRVEEGRFKVVSLLGDVATARILGMKNPVFPPGVGLRPDRRVR